MAEILQRTIPFNPFQARPMPGIQPMAMQDWIVIDDAYGQQLERKQALLATCHDEVLRLDDAAVEAARELLELVLATVFPAQRGPDVETPDGRVVALNLDDPLGTLGGLVQEDFCILQKRGDAHHLTGALLCFPASWMLSEKFLRPLTEIHAPVVSYDDTMGARVQRLFDGVRPGRPMWRSNALWYDDPELYQPRSQQARRAVCDPRTAPYFRSERQSILRLPNSGAVVFSIHTYVLARKDALAYMQNTPPDGRGVMQ